MFYVKVVAFLVCIYLLAQLINRLFPAPVAATPQPNQLGDLRLDTETCELEVHNGSGWVPVVPQPSWVRILHPYPTWAQEKSIPPLIIPPGEARD